MSRASKYLNAVHAGSSFLVSSLLHHPVVSHMPPVLGIELTNHCNLHCPECFTGAGLMTRPKGYMDIRLFNRIIDEMRPYLFRVNLYFQGEPMMHPQFFGFIEKAAGLHITVSTNGQFLDKESCERILKSDIGKLIISLDGIDQETYSKYRRGGDIQKVIAGIRMLSSREAKNHKPTIEIQCLVNHYNEDQVKALEEFARECRVDFKLKSMQVYDRDRLPLWMPRGKRYWRYGDDGNIRGPMPDRCARLWLNPVITWDGKVVPCCFDKDADHAMGDMNKETFREIWSGAPFTEFRKKVLTGRKDIEICRGCTSGMKGI